MSKATPKDWRVGFTVKNTCCYPRGPEFDSYDPCQEVHSHLRLTDTLFRVSLWTPKCTCAFSVSPSLFLDVDIYKHK